MAKEKIQVAGGIGESKLFQAPPGTFPEPAVLECHVGGVRIRDLPPEMQGKILYQQTDEGLAESDAGKSALHAHVTADPVDRAIQLQAGGVAAQREPWEARDILDEVAKAHLKPGERPRFLSPRVCDLAGTRGFEVVKTENGDPVKVGTLMLGKMSEERAEKRNEYFRNKSAVAVGAVEQQFKEAQDRGMRELGVKAPPRALDRSGDDLAD